MTSRFCWALALCLMTASTALAQAPRGRDAGDEFGEEAQGERGDREFGRDGEQERRFGPGGPEGEEGGRGGFGRGGFGMRLVNPMFAALDADGDGSISKTELRKAAAALAKLDADGDIAYSTYFGNSEGLQQVEITALVVDDENRAVMAGFTTAPIPVANAFQPGPGQPMALELGASDAFVTRWAADGQGLVHSTYLGGGSVDRAWDLALGPGGDVFVAGGTSSPDFPVSGGLLRCTTTFSRSCPPHRLPNALPRRTQLSDLQCCKTNTTCLAKTTASTTSRRAIR